MIRPAAPGDAEQVIPLLYEAIGDIAHLLSGTEDFERTMEVLTSFYHLPGNRISYENAIVEETEGMPVGFALFYDGSRMGALDEPLLGRLRSCAADPNVVAVSRRKRATTSFTWIRSL